MSHIATTASRLKDTPCHYYGRAHFIRLFYKQPMALTIKQMREERGWTQADLAERSGMSRSQLAMIEAETRPANTLRLNAIAKAFGVSTEMLFKSGEEDRRILNAMKHLSPEDRAAIVRMAEALANKDSSGI